jgi:hypothetical protein
MLQWLREMLAAPAQDFPDFPAALAFMLLLQRRMPPLSSRRAPAAWRAS